MASLTKSVVIHTPVEKAFEYLRDPTHEPEFWPSLLEIKDVHLHPDGGHTDRWAYKMLGIRFEGTAETTEYVPNERIVEKTKGGVESVQTWMFEPQGDDTKVTFQVDYTVPIPVLGKMAEAVIVKLNDHEGDVLMQNLKTILEAA